MAGAQRRAQRVRERMQIAARRRELFVPGGSRQRRLRPADERGVEGITARQQCTKHLGARRTASIAIACASAVDDE
jgi:hypothetical protein